MTLRASRRDSETFALTPAGEVVWLGARMTLVDAGDYDADGHSELVFFITDEHNHEGYVLVPADFHRPVKFEWSHH